MGKTSTRQDLPLSGYADRLSARPGESLDIKVSSLSQQPYQASLVRVRYAAPNPDGPGVKLENIPSIWEGAYPTREQKFFPGSYGVSSEKIFKPCSLRRSKTIALLLR